MIKLRAKESKVKATVKSFKNIKKPIHRLSSHSFLIGRFCRSQEISRKD